MPHFLALFRRLLSSTSANNPTSSKIIHLLRTHTSPPTLESLLSSTLPPNHHITPPFFSSILRCSNSIPPLHALRFFLYSSTHRNFHITPFFFSSLSITPSLLHQLLDVYNHEQVPVSLKTFKLLLRLCHHSNLPLDAFLSILKGMPNFGCLPDVPLFNSILKISSLPPSEAYSLFTRMKTEFSLTPDVVTYVNVVKKLCEEGRLKDAKVLVERMEEEDGCTPNVVMYSALLEGACGCGDLEAGFEILEQMEKKGETNVVSYTCLMKWLCEVGKVDEALDVLDRMMMNGCRPNRVTLRTLIRGFCVEGRVDDVYKIIDKAMVNNDNNGGVSGDEVYSLLVLCLLRAGERKKMELLLCRMLEMNVKPDGVACNSFLREICEKGSFLEGYDWINAFEAKGVNCVDSDVYASLLRGLCEGCNWEEALNLGRMVVENDVKIEDSCVNSVVDTMEKMGKCKLAFEILKIRGGNRNPVGA